MNLCHLLRINLTIRKNLYQARTFLLSKYIKKDFFSSKSIFSSCRTVFILDQCLIDKIIKIIQSDQKNFFKDFIPERKIVFQQY